MCFLKHFREYANVRREEVCCRRWILYSARPPLAISILSPHGCSRAPADFWLLIAHHSATSVIVMLVMRKRCRAHINGGRLNITLLSTWVLSCGAVSESNSDSPTLIRLLSLHNHTRAALPQLEGSGESAWSRNTRTLYQKDERPWAGRKEAAPFLIKQREGTLSSSGLKILKCYKNVCVLLDLTCSTISRIDGSI